MKSGVYYITNKITNETYIGSSKDIKQRWLGHKNKKLNTKISLSIQQYGWENHIAGVITYCPIEEAKKLEKQYIEVAKPKLNIYTLDFDQKEYDKTRHQSFRQSAEGKEWYKAYFQKAEYKAKKKEYNKAYRQTAEHKEYMKEYLKAYRAKKKTQQGDI